jgi:uridine kinase
MNENKKIIYVEGNSGSGKSLLLSHINEKMKNNNFTALNKKKFPIYINLS